MCNTDSPSLCPKKCSFSQILKAVSKDQQLLYIMDILEINPA